MVVPWFSTRSPARTRARRQVARLVGTACVVAVLAGCTVPRGAGESDAESVPPARVLVGISYGPRPEQVLDIRYPTEGTGPFPVVVYAHSGGWIGGSRANMLDVIAALPADTGVAVVSIDYRLASRNPDGSYSNAFPAAQQDMDRAIRWVRLHAREYDFDAGTIIAAGSSAGGQIAALAGVAPGMFADPTLSPAERDVSPRVQGVIDYVGPSDFSTFANAGGWAPGIEASLLACPNSDDAVTCDPAMISAASVAPHLTAAAPPAYLAYGARDTLVLPTTQGTPLASAWASVRGDLARSDVSLRGVWYELAPDADHNFTEDNSNYRAMELWVRWVVRGWLA